MNVDRRIRECRLSQMLANCNMMTMFSKKKKYEVADFGGMENRRHSLDMESSIGDVEMVGNGSPTDRFGADEATNDIDSDSDSDNDSDDDNATKHYPMARMIYVAEMDMSD